MMKLSTFEEASRYAKLIGGMVVSQSHLETLNNPKKQ